MVSKHIFEGIITPSSWDLKGNIESISLQTVDEMELLIEENRLERELRALINAKVELKGKARELLSGKKSLSVREFKLVDSYRGDRK